MTDDSEVRLDEIEPSHSNPRKSFDMEALTELSKSISRHGVLQPILLRPHPEDDRTEYELVCGERRFRASREAGLKRIPARIEELDDAEVLEIQISENNQRRDVHPLEEADALHELVEKHGRKGVDVADKLGRPPKYVYRRLKLADLVDPLRQLLDEGRIGITTAEELGRLPADFQRELVEAELHPDTESYGSPREWNSRQVEHLIEDHSRKIDNAPWKLDVCYNDIRMCSGCPRRSGEQPSLLDDGGDVDDRCLDGDCWDRKLEAWKESRAHFVENDTDKEVLEDEDAEELNERWYRQNEYVEVDTECYKDEEGRTYGELAPDATRHVFFRDSSGTVREKELVRREDVVDELVDRDEAELAVEVGPGSRSSSSSSRSEERRKEHRRRRKLMGEVVGRVEAGVTESWLSDFVRMAIDNANLDHLKAIAVRRDLDRDEDAGHGLTAYRAAVSKEVTQDEEELRGLLVELLLTPSMRALHRSDDTPWKAVLKRLDLDDGEDEE